MRSLHPGLLGPFCARLGDGSVLRVSVLRPDPAPLRWPRAVLAAARSLPPALIQVDVASSTRELERDGTTERTGVG